MPPAQKPGCESAPLDTIRPSTKTATHCHRWNLPLSRYERPAVEEETALRTWARPRIHGIPVLSGDRRPAPPEAAIRNVRRHRESPCKPGASAGRWGAAPTSSKAVVQFGSQAGVPVLRSAGTVSPSCCGAGVVGGRRVCHDVSPLVKDHPVQPIRWNPGMTGSLFTRAAPASVLAEGDVVSQHP